jgi:hypothetical protein
MTCINIATEMPQLTLMLSSAECVAELVVSANEVNFTVSPPVGRKELCDGKDSSLGSRLVLIMEYRCGEIESFSSLTYVNLLAMCALKIIERELNLFCLT